MADTEQDYRDKYEAGLVRNAIALKNLTVLRLEQRWATALAPAEVDPRVSPSFNATVAALDLEAYKEILPEIRAFTKEGYRDWTYRTLTKLQESDAVADAALRSVYKKAPALETNMESDIARLKAAYQKRRKTTQVVLGISAGAALMLVVLGRK
jgi:hypothetical protein